MCNTNLHISKYKLYMLWETSRRPYIKWSVPCGLWGKRIPHREDSKYKTLRWEQAWYEESEGVRKVIAEGSREGPTIRTLPLTIWEGRVLDCQQRNKVLVNAGQETHCKAENQQAETPIQSLSRNRERHNGGLDHGADLSTLISHHLYPSSTHPSQTTPKMYLEDSCLWLCLVSSARCACGNPIHALLQQ